MLRARIRSLGTFTLTVALLMLAIGRPAHAATITVTNTDDSGPGSLRQAIVDAAAGDTIDFDLPGCPCTITLTSGELVTSQNLWIRGPGADVLTISGNSTSRVFRVAAAFAEISGLHVRDGQANSGGGIQVEQAELTLRDAVISHNSAVAGVGGGIYSFGTLTIINSAIALNHAKGDGGGIRSNGPLAIRNSNLLSNSSYLAGGIRADGAVLITGATFSGNVSEFGASALLSNSHLPVTIIGSTFNGNRAEGGGDALDIAFTSQLTIVNTTISGNFPVGLGIDRSTITSTIINSTIVFNSLDDIRTKGERVVLSNTIVGDIAAFEGDIDTANNNVIGGDLSATIHPLADNGGPTPTHALVANGPAVDAGSNAWLPADTFDLDGDGDMTEPLPVDQRGPGFPRTVGATVDIGAFEGAECSAMTVTPAQLPHGTIGVAYSQQLSATGGRAPHTFSVAGLPPGLSLSSTGLLSGTPTGAGPFTMSVTVTESGGCTATIELTLTITLPFSGFFAPVNNLPTVNTVNAGRAIPVKFSLGGNRGLSIFAAGYPQIRQINCNSGALQDPVEETVTAGNSGLSYDATTGIYSYVWKTNKAWTGTCWQLILRLTDGTDHSATFAFK